MTSKRNLEKRLGRLEAERERKRTTMERFDGEIDEAGVDALIAFSHRRLSDPDSTPTEVIASSPTEFQEYFAMVAGDDES